MTRNRFHPGNLHRAPVTRVLSIPITTPVPTEAQMGALHAFRLLHRPRWKKALTQAWKSGKYPALDRLEDKVLLQQVRKRCGMQGVEKAFRKPYLPLRCPDCGMKGERKGHMTCQYPRD